MANTPSNQVPAHVVPEAIAKGPTFLGHPRGLFLLFIVEMWERFSYYGMRGLLILYLTAAIAAHQKEQGTYENTLRITQALVPTEEEEKAKIEPKQIVTDIPLRVIVGSQPGEATLAPVAVEGGLLTFEHVDAAGKALGGNAPGLAAPTFAVQQGHRPTGESVHFKVVNPTDRKVSLKMKLLRPFSDPAKEGDNPDYKVYFKVNDSTSVISTNIGPEATRDPRDENYSISLDINRVDSGRSWLKADAGTLYGWYTGMAYLLPILGGLIADKLIGTHRSMVVGSLLITLGHLALGASGFGKMAMDATGMAVFVFGLAIITIGTGHFKPNVSVMVGSLYAADDPRRESAFSIFYMGINLGAFLCNLVCGYLAEKFGWHYGFGAAAVGMIAGLLIYLTFKPAYLPGIGDSDSAHRGKAWLFLPVGIALAVVIALLFKAGVLRQFDEFVGKTYVFVSLVVAGIAYAVWFIMKQPSGDRGPVATIFIYMLFNAVFWLSFEQAGSSLTTFTDELTDRGFMGGKISTATFQSVNPFLIIVLAPIFGVFWAALARRKKSIGQPYKIGLGLVFVGLGYIVMVLAAMRLNSGIAKVGMIYICGCYFLHTVGEIILSPTGLSYVAKTAPKRDLSSLMGIWFISSFIAGLAAGKVSSMVDPIIEGKVKLPWNLGGQADFFLLFVISSIAAGLLIFVLSPLLTKMQRSPQD